MAYSQLTNRGWHCIHRALSAGGLAISFSSPVRVSVMEGTIEPLTLAITLGVVRS